MKRFAWLLFLVVTVIARGQNTNTPNIGLEIPPYGSNNWNIPLNYNFTQLDLLLSGNAALPGLSVTGYASMPGLTTWKSSFPYAIGNVVFYQGTAFTSLVAGNQGNTPVQGSFWSATINGGGGSIPDTTLVLKGNNTGGAVAATLNVDYLSPTYWASLSGCTTAGYSYIPASNNCLLAGGGANTPATMSLLKGGGVANSVLAATPGVDFLTPGALPGTTALLKGTGIPGSVTPATLNVDYINTSGSITGSAGSLSAASALPNNTTAVTQTTGDTSTNVATDQFVATAVAGGGGGATFPGTNGLVKNTSTTASVTAVAGTDYMPAVPTSTYGLVPVSNGSPANTYSAAQVPLSFGAPTTQYVQQPLDNGFFTSFDVNNINWIFNVDGFTSYSGVGSAVIPYSSAADVPECQVVSYSGNYYIALNSSNKTVTPGTLSGVWYPVTNNLPATAADCTFYMAASFTKQNHRSSKIQFGSGLYTSNQSFIEPVDGNSFDDQFSVSGEGAGDGPTYLQYTGTAGIPLINRKTGAGNFTSMRWANMKIDENQLASAAIEVGTIGQSYFENISAGNPQPGSDHVLEFGHSGGDAFQVFVSNVNVGAYPDSGTMNCANITANIVGSSITSYTVNSGGTCYSSSYNGLTVVALRGYQGGTAAQPCTVMPTGMTATITGTAVSAVSAGTGGSGCVGPVYVQVYQTENVNYGIVYWASDSTLKDAVLYDGATAGLYLGGDDDSIIHVHPSVIENGIYDAIGGGIYTDTELDAIGGCGFNFQEPFTFTGSSVKGTHGYIGSSSTSRLLYGAATYCLATNSTYVNFGASGPLLQASNPGPAQPTGWVEFVTPSGPIVNPSDYATKTNKIAVTANDYSAGETAGDFIRTLSVGTFSPANISLPPLGTATSGTNYSSGSAYFYGSYYNGSALQDYWQFYNSVGSGTNPQSILSFAHGSASTATPGISFGNGTNLYLAQGGSVSGTTGTITSGGSVAGKHLGGETSGGATVTAGAGAGTSPTVALVANFTDVSGYVTVTTGTSPTASAAVFTVTFGTAYGSAPKCFAWPANAATQALVGVAAAQIFPANINTTTFALTQGSTALSASTAYEWGYQCTQ